MSQSQPTFQRLSSQLDYQLFRSSRRRSVSIEVHRDQSVRVRAPTGFPQGVIEAMLFQRLDWIQRKQREQAARPAPPPSLAYYDGSEHLYLGERWTLRLTVGPASIQRQDEPRLLQLQHPDLREAAVRNQLLQWYRREAEAWFQQRLEVWRTSIAGWTRQPIGLRHRILRRTWGSCTAGGVITLNTLAIKLPPALIDYILCHELCHLREMNHGPAFHAHHAALMPDYRQRSREIRQWEPLVLRT